jgi:5'-deoxynucleotidase YfbR-like HD superfamily hydrolase
MNNVVMVSGNSGKDQSSIEARDVIDLGLLILKFSRVERAIVHEDGLRPETDSDHTVMLGVLGCAIATKLRPDLDNGRIAQFALVHDLVEVYAGDTPTFNISKEERLAKQSREALALKRITIEFGKTFPWLIETIEDYESLKLPEARFVKALDKLLPKITHVLNKGVTLKKMGFNREDIETIFEINQIKEMSSYSFDQPEIMALRKELVDLVIETMFGDQ